MTACERSAFYFLLLLTLGQAPLSVTAGKILIWPGEFSHWLNMKVIVDKLIARGHNVTTVTHSATPSVKTTRSPGYNVDIIQVPHTKQDFVESLEKFMNYWTYEMENDSIIQVSLKMKEIFDLIAEQNYIFCQNLFARDDLLEKWRKEGFEVLLTDPMTTCGDLLAQKLNLPFIISLRFSFGNVIERLCGQLPAPPSYVPGVTICHTDQMNFPQRLKNVLFNLYQDLMFSLVVSAKWDSLYTEFLALTSTVFISLFWQPVYSGTVIALNSPLLPLFTTPVVELISPVRPLASWVLGATAIEWSSLIWPLFTALCGSVIKLSSLAARYPCPSVSLKTLSHQETVILDLKNIDQTGRPEAQLSE
ncbi:hypothetical protein MHYP_G00282990 [Metynnis hypsauchen]